MVTFLISLAAICFSPPSVAFRVAFFISLKPVSMASVEHGQLGWVLFNEQNVVEVNQRVCLSADILPGMTLCNLSNRGTGIPGGDRRHGRIQDLAEDGFPCEVLEHRV